MKKMHILFLLILTTLFSFSQNQKPCSSKEADQFDFWVGTWDLKWNDSVQGSNTIDKMYGNCTIHENFSDPKNSYLGQSWSVYNTNSKSWQQTWVDNSGAYIHLTGGMSGDSMILKTSEQSVSAKVSKTGKLMNRMIFYNITKDAFDWSWESSTDGGASWTPVWQIHYKRKKS